MEELSSALPEVAEGFGRLHEAVFSDGKLSLKQKELIAVGISTAVRCSKCLRHHIEMALNAGATKDEILEAVSVGIVMGGGPAISYALEAIEMLSEK